MFSCKYWEISKNQILKNICVRLLLKILQEVIDQDFLSGESLSKTSRLSNITKIPFAFKPVPSLNLTPTLCFELRFPIFIINCYDRKANACSPWTFCFTSKYFLSGQNTKKQLHIFLQKQPHIFFNIFSEAAACSLKNMKYFQEHPHICLNTAAQIFLFRSSRPFCLISFRSDRTFFQKHEIFSKAVAHLLNIKNTFRSSCTNFHGCCTKYTHLA